MTGCLASLFGSLSVLQNPSVFFFFYYYFFLFSLWTFHNTSRPFWCHFSHQQTEDHRKSLRLLLFPDPVYPQSPLPPSWPPAESHISNVSKQFRIFQSHCSPSIKNNNVLKHVAVFTRRTQHHRPPARWGMGPVPGPAQEKQWGRGHRASSAWNAAVCYAQTSQVLLCIYKLMLLTS